MTRCSLWFPAAKLTLTTLLEIYKPAKYGRSRVQSYLSDLLSILQFHEDKLVLYHTSMTDFLRDNSRSGEYHTDVDKAGTKFLPRLWGGVSTHYHDTHYHECKCRLYIWCISVLQGFGDCSPLDLSVSLAQTEKANL